MDMENIDFNWGGKNCSKKYMATLCARVRMCLCVSVRVRRSWRTRDEAERSSKQLRDSLAARVLMRGNGQLRSTFGGLLGARPSLCCLKPRISGTKTRECI